MPSPTTEEAIKIIAEAPEHGPMRPLEYAAALPQRAGALARAVSHATVVTEAERFRAADRSAVLWRLLHSFLARSVLVLAALSVVLGGVRLYLTAAADVVSIEAVRVHLVQAQPVLLGAWLVCVIALVTLRPARRWFLARAGAELSRQRLFERLMAGSEQPATDEAPLLPLQLECFRRHLLDTQRRFFQRRSQQNRRAVGAGRLFGAIALLFIAVASLPQLVAAMAGLDALSWTPDFLQQLTSRLVGDRKLYSLAWLLGISLQLLVTNLATVSPVARHAERYEMMAMLLDFDPWQLAGARDAAAAGTRGPVEWFSNGVLNVLSAEARMWQERQERRRPRWNGESPPG